MPENIANIRGLSLERLHNFLRVVDSGSIVRAAPESESRQSQFSRQIRELEEIFGVELTRRNGRSIAVTEAGHRLATLIRQQEQDLKDFWSEQTHLPKVYSVGAGTSILEWLVAPAAPAISKALGGARLQLESYRSVALIEAVREGRLDFAVVRANAVPKGGKRKPVRHLAFHLCVPRKLLPRGKGDADLADPALWQILPFAAGKDGGQLDKVIRAAMAAEGVTFHPSFECMSILLVRQLIEQGHCAGILPSVGLAGLSPKDIAIAEFPPLKAAGRSLVLHWNERHMSRRGVPTGAIEAIFAVLSAPPSK